MLLHPAECYYFLSKILYRAADEINRIVNDKKSVMYV